MKDAVRTTKVPDVKDFDCSVFDGIYVSGGIDAQYLDDLQQKRSDSAMKESKKPCISRAFFVIDWGEVFITKLF